MKIYEYEFLGYMYGPGSMIIIAKNSRSAKLFAEKKLEERQKGNCYANYKKLRLINTQDLDCPIVAFFHEGCD